MKVNITMNYSGKPQNVKQPQMPCSNQPYFNQPVSFKLVLLGVANLSEQLK